MDLQSNHPEFIDEFLSSSMINGNILICSGDKFVKIYHDENKKIKCSLQNYYDYLPEASEFEYDRTMSAESMQNCPMHSRLLMQFSYPSSCKPKELVAIPYINDNTIQMNIVTDTGDQIISWLSSISEDGERKLG